MKKLNFLFLSLFVASFAVLVACDDDPEPVEPDTLSVRPLTLGFEADDTQSKSVTVETNVAAGFTLSPESDDNFTITRTASGFDVAPKTANEDTENDRKLTITVRAGGAAEQTVTVTQVKKGGLLPPPEEDYLEIDPERITFKAGEEVAPRKVEVDTNIADWSYTNTAEWIIVEKFADHITIAVTLPAPEQERSDVVKIQGGDIEKTVTVTQEAAPVVPETFDGFTAVGDFQADAVPFFGTSIGYVYQMQGTYTGGFDITIDPSWTSDSDPQEYYTVTVENGDPANGRDAGKRYLTIAISGNDSEAERDVEITVIPTELEASPAVMRFTQKAIAGKWSARMRSVQTVLDRFRQGGSSENPDYDGDVVVKYDADTRLVKIEYIYESVSFGGNVTNRWSDITLFIEDDEIFTRDGNFVKHSFNPDRYRQIIVGVNGRTAYEPATFTDTEKAFPWEIADQGGREVLKPQTYMLGNIPVELGFLMADEYGNNQIYPCIGAWTDIEIYR